MCAAAACCRHSLTDSVRRRSNMQGMWHAGHSVCCSGDSRTVCYRCQVVNCIADRSCPVLECGSVHRSPDRVSRCGCMRSCLHTCKARVGTSCSALRPHIILCRISTDQQCPLQYSRLRACLLSKAARWPALSRADRIRCDIGSHCKGSPNVEVESGRAILVLNTTCSTTLASICRLRIGNTCSAGRGVNGGGCRKTVLQLLQCHCGTCALVPCK